MTATAAIDTAAGTALTTQDAARVQAAVEASASANTRRAYRRAWTAWAAARGVQTLPAAPSAVAADRGRGSQRQAAPLTDCVLAAIRATAPDGRRGRVEVAMVHLLRDADLRRSEAAALTWGDIRVEADGTGRVIVRRSKTDQTGNGAVVAVTIQRMGDLTAIRDGAPDDAPVLGLSPSRTARRVQAAAGRAGLDATRYSGHSGRVGLAQRMVAAGAPMPTVMRQGRWADTRMVARYTRAERAGASLAYLG